MRYPDLEVSEDMRQERREWRVQRIVWLLLSLLLLAAMLGLFGSGPLSKTTAGAPSDPLRIEYQRFMRYRSPDTLQVTVVPSTSNTEVMLDKQYLRYVRIKSVTPEPVHVITGSDAVTFVLNTASSAPFDVVFELRPEKIGTAKGWIALKGEPRQTFRQFIYP